MIVSDDDLLKAEKRFRSRAIFTRRREGLRGIQGAFLLLCVLVVCGIVGMAVGAIPDLWEQGAVDVLFSSLLEPHFSSN